MNKTQEENYSEFYKKHLRRVQKMVRVFGFSGQNASDVVQQIFTEFIGGDYLNVYDSSRSKESTFLWNFVRGRCMREITVRSRERAHVPMQVGQRDGELNLGYFVSSQNGNNPLVKIIREEQKQLFRNLLNQLLSKLREQSDGGVYGCRASILEMLVQGRSRKEIARDLGYSQSSISLGVKSIRQEKEANELREALKGAV